MKGGPSSNEADPRPDGRDPDASALGPGAEFDLIRSMLGARRPLPSGVEVGPGDDCAVLEGGLVVSCDMVVEDVHFRRSWLTPREIGQRAAAAALSDIAAMAARPVAVLLSCALPPTEAPTLGPALQEGAESACRSVGAAVVGGDLTASPGPLVLDVVVLGRTDAPVLRSGARPGDELWVTGRLGGAAAAVSLLVAGDTVPDGLRRAFARPEPRTAEALWLAERAEIHALIDLSDGLAGDAVHLATASGVTLLLDGPSIPVAPDVAAAVGGEDEAFRIALTGGEDYELLLAAPEGAIDAVAGAFRETFQLPLTRIGRVEASSRAPVLVRSADGTVVPPPQGSWDHFAGKDR